ncbi:MAG: translation initiation factor IF-2 N-terminal domain-containing protein, partial [Clostridia bacterium]
MSIEDYAKEMNVSIEQVIEELKTFEINLNDKDDILDDEAIIILDNKFSKEENEVELDSELEEKFDLEDRAFDIIESTGIKMDHEKKQKLKKKNDTIKSTKEEYQNKKKNVYKNKKKLQTNEVENNTDVILYTEGMTVALLATALGIESSELVKKLVLNGLMINVNETISFDDAYLVCIDYKKELKKEENVDISNFEEYEVIDKEEDLIVRAPVVTIMGHVDHGKTSLLDYIRSSHVASGEAGGITQAIGAYQVDYNGEKITFVDTPGHAAFTEMRARGAQITDIVIIIVAADDGVMPQTKEAIDHAKSAGAPIIVAINKIDKTTANVDRILSELGEYGLTPESWGGDTIFVKISAHTGEGIDLLLENILALASMMELKANPKRYALGTVIEA